MRYHLRVEHSGQALLLAGAAEVLRLTTTGAIAAYGILEGKADTAIVTDLASMPRAAEMIAEVRQKIDQLGRPSSHYPIFNLADPLVEEFPHGLIAPFQADVVLTDCDRLKQYLSALWQAGIPHVRFVNTESAMTTAELAGSLCSAVEFAEDLGMIAGLRLSSSALLAESQPSLLDRVAGMGLDYVVVPWGVTEAQHRFVFRTAAEDCLVRLVERAAHWEITPVLEAGLVLENVELFEERLDGAIEHGVRHFEVYAIAQHPRFAVSAAPVGGEQALPADTLTAFQADHLRQLAGWIEDLADDRCVQIVWLPTVSCPGQLQAEQVQGLLACGPRAGADISLRIDSDGQVIPPRGPGIRIGQIHRQSWESLWNHAAFRRFREMVDRVEHCPQCPLMTVCAAHCPADPAGWAMEDAG
jgi:radical SAM protein with 4Fe4S-binding SPASM domain